MNKYITQSLNISFFVNKKLTSIGFHAIKIYIINGITKHTHKYISRSVKTTGENQIDHHLGGSTDCHLNTLLTFSIEFTTITVRISW